MTLFVNGIPLVVIEAKPPGKESAISDAVDQLRRYVNQRDSQVAEGSEQLFWTNQLTVATTGERAEAGTFSGRPSTISHGRTRTPRLSMSWRCRSGSQRKS